MEKIKDLLEKIEETEEVKKFFEEIDYYLNFDHGCIDPECEEPYCEHESIWDVEEEENCTYGKDLICEYINHVQDSNAFDKVRWLEEHILKFK